MQEFSTRLLRWWDQHGRKDLPWQQDKTPYRVWVSEIMLQQTQVSTVIEYYLRFMARFPTIQALAHAQEDEVLAHWAGLGYYARARNLHKTAKIVSHDYQGHFPHDFDQIVALPGIGRSTAGAILSIAFQQPTPILDGNVKRVLCRIKAIREWPGEKKTENALWELAEQFTPKKRADDYTQAIMDLGATLCTRTKADCSNCPMISLCEAAQQDIVKELPKSKPKKASPTKHTWLLHITNDLGEILMEKRPPTGIWGGLFSLPELNFETDISEITKTCAEKWQLKVHSPVQGQSFVHVFSHYKLNASPVHLQAHSKHTQINDSHQFRWIEPSQLRNIGLPAPIEKYLNKQTQSELPLAVE